MIPSWFLVLAAGGPQGRTPTAKCVTPNGRIDCHMRYLMDYDAEKP